MSDEEYRRFLSYFLVGSTFGIGVSPPPLDPPSNITRRIRIRETVEHIENQMASISAIDAAIDDFHSGTDALLLSLDVDVTKPPPQLKDLTNEISDQFALVKEMEDNEEFKAGEDRELEEKIDEQHIEADEDIKTEISEEFDTVVEDEIYDSTDNKEEEENDGNWAMSNPSDSFGEDFWNQNESNSDDG